MNGLFAFTPGPMEMLILGVVAVLLFGERLPEVGRSLGRSLIEFKKGIRGIQDEIMSAATAPPPAASRPAIEADDRQEATAPKFVPPSSEPRANTVEG